MTANESIGGDERVASWPRSRVKFLCSYGGKILPRPGNANLNLKYVGGETRLVAVPWDIKFSGEMILKYQVIPEELDALVTVKSDEDLKHMVNEYYRLESEATSPKLRAFLFPSSPVVFENQMNPVYPYAIEQRYIEAVNGIVSPSSNTCGRVTPVNGNRLNFSISACSSPKSASPDDGKIIDFLPLEPPLLNGYHHNRLTLLKVQSPTFYRLSTLHLQSNNNHSNHQVYQPHQYYRHHLQMEQIYNVQSLRPTHDFRAEQSPVPHDFGRGPMGHGNVPIKNVYSIGRHNLANGYTRSACCRDECLDYASSVFSLPTVGRPDCPKTISGNKAIG